MGEGWGGEEEGLGCGGEEEEEEEEDMVGALTRGEHAASGRPV